MTSELNADELREVVGDESEVEDVDDDETSVAEAFGWKTGVPVGLVAVYAMFLGPDRVVGLSPVAGDLLAVQTGDGAGPFVLVSGATLVAGFVGGLAFTVVADELEADYRQDLAIGVLFPPVVVVLLVVLVVLLEPVANHLVAGQLVDATILFVVEAVVAAIVVGSSIGILAAMVVFGVYFGIPSFVGVYAGSLLGELGRRLLGA
ncbi:hypothetical protein [Haloarchaeobius sp. HRN-SO-5]|uniref:hypothetical protein n=1 Tax=Haloarchaeobius sp. HRN-SO-5 TaxID=3446118 RepID=UPI003EBF8221